MHEYLHTQLCTFMPLPPTCTSFMVLHMLLLLYHIISVLTWIAAHAFGTSIPSNENALHLCTCVLLVIYMHIFDQVFEGSRMRYYIFEDKESLEMIKEWVLAHLAVSSQAHPHSKPTV